MKYELDMNNIPEHIGIIMDGNGRFAKQQGLSRSEGHKAGAEKLVEISNYCTTLGIKYLTVYAFSTENWKRAQDEVQALMLLLQGYIDKYSKIADSENIKVQFLGDMSAFTDRMQKGIQDCRERTKNNTGVTFNIALNYGGRNELVYAIKKIAQKVKNNEIELKDINEEMISDNLYTAGMPDPELMIRTSGEIRTSNFLPWQLTYTEFLFVDKNWPDFTEEDLDNAIMEYQKRTRKFGAN